MSITTIGGHIARALDLFNHNDLWFCIGKPTTWTDEANPPSPVTSLTDVPEIVGFKKAEHVYLVVPDEAGDIYYRDGRWRIVPMNDAVASQARWVFVECNLRYDELPLSPYRVVGLYSGLVPVEGTPAGTVALIPNQVESKGILEVVDYRKVVNRQLDQRENLCIIVEL